MYCSLKPGYDRYKLVKGDRLAKLVERGRKSRMKLATNFHISQRRKNSNFV